MKNLIFTLILVGCFGIMHSQSPKWINYTNGDRIPVIKTSNDFIWIGYFGGVTRINPQTQEKVFYNLANSNLPSQWIYDLDVDQNGTVWVGAYKGLCRIVGENMEVFSSLNSGLPADNVKCVDVNENGDVWIVSYESGSYDYYLTKYDGQNWTSYNHENSILPEYKINSIVCESQDIVWISALNGLIKFDNGEWTLYDECVPQAVAIDGENNKWVKTSGSLYFFDDNNFELIGDMSGNQILIDDNDIKWSYGFTDSGSPNISGFGIFSYDGQSIHNYNMQNSNLPSDAVFSFCIDNNNSKWCGIYKMGLFKEKNDDWEFISCSNSLIPSIQILSISEDNEGKLWFGGGPWDSYLTPSIAIYDENSWSRTQFSSFNGQINDVLFDHTNTAWICASNIGLIKYIDNNNWMVYDENNSVFNLEFINCGATDSNGILWIGLEPDNYDNGGGLLKIDQDDWSILTSDNSGLTSDIVTAIDVDENNNLWLIVGEWSENQELQFFNGEEWVSYNSSNSILPQSWMHKVVSAKPGELWVTSNSGLYHFDGTVWNNYNTNNSILPYGHCNAIKSDPDNTIWFSSGDYLMKINNNNWEKIKINSTSNSIFSSFVRDIEIDSKGIVWLGTDGMGVFVYDEDGSSSVNELMKPFKQTLKISPNPSINSADIVFEMKENAPAVISVFNIAGENFYEKTYDNVKQGKNSINLDVSNLTNGTYLLTVSTENTQMSGKLIVQKK